VLITDTDTHVRSGKELGFRTLAVANGIRERSTLAAAHPDHLLDRTLDLLDPELFSPRP
jgi:phosphoglycolate phosphatase-like HAD superfamily hydrolase